MPLHIALDEPSSVNGGGNTRGLPSGETGYSNDPQLFSVLSLERLHGNDAQE